MTRLAVTVVAVTLAACGTAPADTTVHAGSTTTTPVRAHVAEAADATMGLDATLVAHAFPPRPKPRVARARVAQRRGQNGGSIAAGGAMPPRSVMMCESGGNYRAENRTSSASGAWQIIDGTWNGYAGYGHAADAPPHVQDARAAQLWAGGRGASHWKACL